MDRGGTRRFNDHEDDTAASYEGEASLDFERGTPYDDMIESSLTFTGSGELLTPKGSAPTGV